MTIEERSRRYFSGCMSMVQAERKGYYDGAIDQRKIDIKKACEWLSDRYGDELSVTLLEEFRKAMTTS